MDFLVILSFVTIKYCHINNIYKYVKTHIDYDKNVKITNIRANLNNMITNGILYRFNNYYALSYQGNKIYDFIVNRYANKIIGFFRNYKYCKYYNYCKNCKCSKCIKISKYSKL